MWVQGSARVGGGGWGNERGGIFFVFFLWGPIIISELLIN